MNKSAIDRAAFMQAFMVAALTAVDPAQAA